jgi:NADH-quinone oxidoreductase subunit F
VPCRVGVKRIGGTLEGIMSSLGTQDDLALLTEFAQYVPDGSLCGFGVNAVKPLTTAMKYFADDFTAHLDGTCPTGVCEPVRAHRYATKHVL